MVADLSAAAHVAEAARSSGFVRVPGRWFGTDQQGVGHPEEVVVDADPGRPVDINIRPVTAPSWRETLLFRDWLRSHHDERNAYAELKRGCPSDRAATSTTTAQTRCPGSVMPVTCRAMGGPVELVALTVTPTMSQEGAIRLAACHSTSLPSSATFRNQ